MCECREHYERKDRFDQTSDCIEAMCPPGQFGKEGDPRKTFSIDAGDRESLVKDTIGILILLFLIQISLNYLNLDIFRQSWSFKRDYDVITKFQKKNIFADSSSQEGVFTTKIFFSEYLADRLSTDVSHDHFKSFWCKMVILTTYSEK